MNNILLSGSLAFVITFLAIPIIIEVAKLKKLYDEPDERKVHTTVVPTLGGLGIFAGFILATLLGAPLGGSEVQYFAAAAIVIFFIGVKDDILILSPAKKFIGQLVTAGIVIHYGQVQISDMHGLLGINAIPYIPSMLLTFFTVIVIINSFNLIDGVDGLAGSLGLLTSLVFGIYFINAGYLLYGVMAISLTGSLLAFLKYNFCPAKIFMGDTGSLLIGLINAILVIKFINIAGSTTTPMPLQAAPAIGFAILIIPLFDTLRVFALRILQKRSPFSADRLHVHHYLLDLGLTHRAVTFVCLVTNAALILLAYFLRFLGTTIVISILLAISCTLITLIYFNLPKKEEPEEKEIEAHLLPESKNIFLKNPKSVEAE